MTPVLHFLFPAGRSPRSSGSSRLFRAACLAALVVSVAAPAVATAAPALASIDARSRQAPQPPRQFDAAAKRLVRSGTTVRYDERLGLPTFVWTSPSDAGETSRRRARGGSAAEEARRHLSRLASLYGLTDDDVAAARVTQVHDTGKGAIVVKFREDIDGVEVFGEEASVLMNRDLDRVAVSGFLGGARTRANRAASRRVAIEEAVAVALRDRTGNAAAAASDLEGSAAPGTNYRLFRLRASAHSATLPVLPSPLRAKPVWFHDAGGYRPAFYVEVAAEVQGAAGAADHDLYGYVVAADNGEILVRHSLTASDSFDYRAWVETTGERAPLDSPFVDATPHPTGTPGSYLPSYTAPSLVSVQNGPISTMDPWLASGAVESRGNNVDAYADANSPDGFTAGDVRAPVSGPGAFDYAYDTSMEPTAAASQTYAAIVQAFYDTNFLHDAFYDHGFDEAAGNAQNDNYGRGGIAGDRMDVEVQDYSGTDNADMSTPADGGAPRMQLYAWEGVGTVSLDVNTQPGSPVLPSSITPLGTAGFGAASFSTTADLVVVDDGVGSATDGCESPFANAGAVAGRIAFIDRGTCSFVQKVENAVAAGAVGVLIANNVGGTQVLTMTGSCSGPCSVGVLMVTQNQGADIASAIGAGTVNMTMARTAGVAREGALDNQTIAHEWGHYLSGRLVGDGNGLNTNQSGGLGEGWGDFNAMLLTVKEGDDFAGVYPMGAYEAEALSSDSSYFGLRRVPYSTDMTKNPLTFAHIGENVPITGVPCDFGCSGGGNSEVHNTGEVWATMLWECYAALLGDTLGMSPRLTFDQARDRMRGYLVASLKLTPVNPTFTEARDAVLGAALASDPVDAQLFCDAFAKRGIGQGASAPDRFSNNNSGVVESYVCALPANCDAAPRGDCSAAPAGQLKLQGNAFDTARQKLGWKWLKGTAALGDFGDPTLGTTSYRLCLYDDGALVTGMGVGPGGNCGSGPCWTGDQTRLTYKNRSGNSDGFSLVKIKPGIGKAQIQLRGKGSGLALPFPIADSSSVTVQLVKDADSGTECWSTAFAAPALKNDPSALKFQDKLP